MISPQCTQWRWTLGVREACDCPAWAPTVSGYEYISSWAAPFTSTLVLHLTAASDEPETEAAPAHVRYMILFVSACINRVRVNNLVAVVWVDFRKRPPVLHLHLLICPPSVPRLTLKHLKFNFRDLLPSNLASIRMGNTCGANMLCFQLIELLMQNLSTSHFDEQLEWNNQWYLTYRSINVIPRCEFSH